MPRVDKTPDHIKIDEKNHVEEPFLNQLQSLGWEVLRLEKQQKASTSHRENLTDVVMLPVLKEQLIKINPWLEEDQVYEVIRRITSFSKNSLIENNEKVLELILQNTSVSENRKTGEKSPTVKFIEFDSDKISNNSFIAVSQMKIRIPGTEYHFYPDIILFVNGLPLVVVECKSPKVKEPIPEAIDQLMRYSSQRGENKEGNKELFYYNQIIIATCRQEAKFGTITTNIEKHFYRWADPYPYTLNELEHGASSPNDQQRLIHGILDKSNLLSLVRTYTIFSTDNKGKTIKIVGRYQQFRAVKLAVKRLLEGNNKYERGGIIWHTQGSGKSLTMMFLVREMYIHEILKEYKVVFITDRTQLEEQLTETSRSIGFSVNVADSVNKLKKILKTDSSDLVMAMIHKFQERELEESFPELNTSSKILILVDEAHRSQYKLLGANLDRALPYATEIAFTGTPTGRTETRFRHYIDKYTMRQAIEDGVTLEIVYEGRTHSAEIADSEGMDRKFEDVFSEYNLVERLQILGFASRDAYLDSEVTIDAKAKDIVKHYIENVFTEGFKAQVVANSRESAAFYKKALDKAFEEEIQMLSQHNPMAVNLDLLRKLKTGVVISGGGVNEKDHLKKYTGEDYHRKVIASFKLPFDSKNEEITGEVGILIVNNMLLTGFDAPIEQVLYLDRIIKAHNLLQAIARVNRVYNDDKTYGFIVDYVGVGNHIKEALDEYLEKEQQEIIETFKNDDELINELKASYNQILEWLEKNGISDYTDYDAFYDLFYDEDTRFEYITLYNSFSKALDAVYPRKEALDFRKSFLNLSEINVMASKHLRDSRLSMRGVPEKLRRIADEYLVSKGIEQKVEPISIIDEKFFENVKARKRSKTKAAEVEHAIRHYIDLNYDEDPELYASFAETISNILLEFKNNWDEIYRRLEQLRQRIKNAVKEPNYGLHRKKQMPFFRIFKKEFYNDADLTEEQITLLVGLTQNTFLIIRRELELHDFWETPPAINKLRADLQQLLLSEEYCNKLPGIRLNWRSIISRILEVSNKNNDTILYGA